ncbi:chain length determinant protein EpsF [Cycloclasticus pugetii]|uniref:chain length determinant protein EpsF n=1 Tax=Cycloclasticus pugetii TaxID=34068 RepID=UPI000363E55E|nr:chain length determinant protein EpsF [Cycloclasticus pugetii]
MSFYQFMVILLARKKIALLAFFITVATTLALSLMLPKSFEATTTLIVNYKGTDPVTGMVLPAQLMPGYMATQVDIIGSQNVALKVVNTLGLDKSPAAIEAFADNTQGEGNITEWLAGALLKNLDVRPSRESSAINLVFDGSDPQFAAAVANAFADAYIQTSLQLKVEPSVRAAEWFNDQVASLRENLVDAQRKLTSYQRDKGIVSLDQRLDVENSRLSQISQQLVIAQAEAFDSASRRQEANNAGSIFENPDILKNPLIQNMKANLSSAEANLAEVRQRLNTNHPSYRAALAEVSNLRSKLNNELKAVTVSLSNTESISDQRVQDLQQAMDAQKQRLLDTNQERAEMAILQRNVENAQNILDIAMQRFSQTSMEGQANQSDVAILNPAVAPIKHSSPKLLVNMILSVFLGSILAVGLALLAELIDRRVRTPEDISVGLNIPVLGVLKRRASSAKKARSLING